MRPPAQATRVHDGSADGNNVSIDLNAGFDFGAGALRHGPVGSVLSQQIDIDGFAEDDPTLSTSLAYPEQSFDSLIGSLGWQASYDATATFKPYARVSWDRELEKSPAQAFAIAESIPGTLPYAVPGQDLDREYDPWYWVRAWRCSACTPMSARCDLCPAGWQQCRRVRDHRARLLNRYGFWASDS